MTSCLKYDRCSGVDGIVTLPPSKSVALRAEVLSMIFQGSVLIENAPVCDDYIDLKCALDLFYNSLEKNQEIYYKFKDGAAPMRFFVAYVASCPGCSVIIDCSDQLRRRPLAPLVDALLSAGACIEYIEEVGRAPVRVEGKVLNGINDPVGCDISSQFSSALMMASLIWDKPYNLPCNVGIVSAPYVEMTRKMIGQFQDFFCHYEKTDERVVYNIENDWSSASYFYELVLADPSRSIIIRNLPRPSESVQGDSACVEIFKSFGVLTQFFDDGSLRIYAEPDIIARRAAGSPLDLDMGRTPDLVPAVTVGLCLANIPFVVTGVAHLRNKESDRLEALCTELAKAGYPLCNNGESLAFHGKRLARSSSPVCFDSYSDHRMAMALSVAASRLGMVIILNAQCVSKSFPDFFDQLSRVGFSTV